MNVNVMLDRQNIGAVERTPEVRVQTPLVAKQPFGIRRLRSHADWRDIDVRIVGYRVFGPELRNITRFIEENPRMELPRTMDR
jgi:hypothetical protein